MILTEKIILILILLFLVYLLLIRPYVLAKKEFKCSRCGKCCRLTVRLSPEEIAKIKKAGYKNFVDERKNLIKKDGHCIFLKNKDKSTYCKIEKIKPQICKNFPEIITCLGKKRDERCSTCHGRLF